MHVHVINNTDDRGIHGRSLAAKRLASGTTFHHNQDLFVDARTDGVDGEQRRATSRVIERDRLHQQQLGATKRRMLLGRNDSADNTCQLQFDSPTAGPVSWTRRVERVLLYRPAGFSTSQ